MSPSDCAHRMAVSAYRTALLELTRERVPLDWARSQNDLSGALSKLGLLESNTARLEEAVSACRAALLERTRDKVPLLWATSQNSLGNALFSLGRCESGTARLEEAVSAYRAALLEWTRDKVPLDWAMTQSKLGLVLWKLGERQAVADKAKGCSILEGARGHLAAGLEEFQKAGAGYDLHVEVAQDNIAQLDAVLVRLCG